MARADPPPVLSTALVRVRWAGGTATNVLVIEQLAVSPAASTRLLPVSVPPVQRQALGAVAGRTAVSARV